MPRKTKYIRPYSRANWSSSLVAFVCRTESSQAATLCEKNKSLDTLKTPIIYQHRAIDVSVCPFTPPVKMFKLARSRPFTAALKPNKVKLSASSPKWQSSLTSFRSTHRHDWQVLHNRREL
jgi:hypothetical protein